MSDEASRPLHRRLWLRLLACAGGLAAVAVGWWSDVASHRDEPTTPTIAVGARIDAGPYAVTLRSARKSLRAPDGGAFADGPMLIVEADMENLTSASRSDPQIVFAGNGRAPDFYLPEDRARFGALDPRVPKRVALVVAAPQDDAARIVVTRLVFKARDNLSGAQGWFSPTPAAIVTLPVAPLDEGR